MLEPHNAQHEEAHFGELKLSFAKETPIINMIQHWSSPFHEQNKLSTIKCSKKYKEER